MSDNEEEIEYDSVSETSLDSDEEDDKFQASLVVPQQPLIPSRQQSHLNPHLFFRVVIRQDRIFHPAALPAIVPNVVHQDVWMPKGQTTETGTESWELFFDNAMLESITDFTNIKIGLLLNLFSYDSDTKKWTS